MQAVAIAGPKKSGKTNILSLVAEALEQRGKRVAVVKYSGHILEKSNEDAYWLVRPGRPVINVSPEETVAVWAQVLSFEEIMAHLQADVVLLEGDEAPDSIPRILCFREDEDLDAQHFEYVPGTYPVIAVFGAELPQTAAPWFSEADPAAPEKVATLVLEQAPEV